ncbi:arrestin [Xylaria intraflava]|nr:arrestin [Xylaria intraflava]
MMSNRPWAAHGQVSTPMEPTRKNATAPKINMSIHVDNHYQSKIYTTASSVSGHVKVNAPRDTSLDEVRILFLGTGRTQVDTVNIPVATSHVFLKLTMPIPDSFYPEARDFEAGATYSFPFHFIIPQHLTLNACTHCDINASLREDHLRLPPSLGDWDKEDFTPDMTRIRYYLRASTYQEDGSGKCHKVAEATHDIKVIPLVAEAAPLNITKQDKLYVMTRSKALRRSILSSKLGSVTASANQPAPVMIGSDGYSVTPTTAQIDLVFEPTTIESQPPKITGVTSKVTAVTYYSSSHVCQYPNLKDWYGPFGSEGRGSYSSSVSLPTTRVESAPWMQYLTPQGKRDSGYASQSHSDSDRSQGCRQPLEKQSQKGAPYYYATKVQVSIQLPAARRQFIPTFHACIASRVYVLWMAVTLSVPTGKSSTITLGVPLQIGVGSRAGAQVGATGPPSFEAAVEDASFEVDTYLRPRTLSVPDIEFCSVLPGYSTINNRRA